MEAHRGQIFRTFSEKVGQFSLREKIFLIPEMNRIGCHLLAGTFRGFGINALVMPTYEGLDRGKEFTSGKECFPCQVTMGDILQYLDDEKERLGADFEPENYIYFMPEATGPCRFGMYNKFQRIVLDSFPELKNLKIGSLTTGNSYSVEGLIDEEHAQDFRKVAYFSVVISDLLDRLLWRVRPYEKAPGLADRLAERAMREMSDAFETDGPAKDFDRILERLETLVEEAKSIIDPAIPRKPLIGVVGEIYLRTHVEANQDIIRLLERYGGEVVNASLAEWVNYTTYDGLREAKQGFRLSLKQWRYQELKDHLKKIIAYGGKLWYQQAKQRQAYDRVRRLIDLAEDHRIKDLEKTLTETDVFSFDLGTEACLSIPGIIEYVRHGFSGVVNVYPFTCMPSTVTSAVVKPLMSERKVPYLDAPYDGSFQPGREAAIRTFMYQAQQHLERHNGKGRKNV
jgi:predicted nucleotide-binding protein (sugar kinase/HSP70/actin superfamily)